MDPLNLIYVDDEQFNSNMKHDFEKVFVYRASENISQKFYWICS